MAEAKKAKNFLGVLGALLALLLGLILFLVIDRPISGASTTYRYNLALYDDGNIVWDGYIGVMPDGNYIFSIWDDDGSIMNISARADASEIEYIKLETVSDHFCVDITAAELVGKLTGRTIAGTISYRFYVPESEFAFVEVPIPVQLQ